MIRVKITTFLSRSLLQTPHSLCKLAWFSWCIKVPHLQQISNAQVSIHLHDTNHTTFHCSVVQFSHVHFWCSVLTTCPVCAYTAQLGTSNYNMLCFDTCLTETPLETENIPQQLQFFRWSDLVVSSSHLNLCQSLTTYNISIPRTNTPFAAQ